MNTGWVKLHRSLLDWEWWHDHNTTRLFVYLLLAANVERKKWSGIEVMRGQLVTSRAKLSERTGLSEKQVRLCLDKLKKGQQIDIKTASKFSVITICNYGKFQDAKTDEGPAKGQQQGRERATTKEVKKEEETTLRKSANESSRFDEFWTAYPRKKSKVDAIKAWKQVKGDSIFEEIMSGLQRAIVSPDWQKSSGQFIPYPASWLRAGGWMDEAEGTTQKACGTCRHNHEGACPEPGKVCESWAGESEWAR